MSGTELILRSEASNRGYEHPRDRFRYSQAPERPLFGILQQKMMTEQLGPSLTPEHAVHLVGRVALGHIRDQDQWEQIHLGALGINTEGISDSPDASMYYQLAGNPEKMDEFIKWVSTVSLGASALNGAEIIDFEHRVARHQMIGEINGHSLELGTALQLGDWDASLQLDESVNFALESLKNEGWKVRRRTSSRRALGRHQVAFVYDTPENQFSDVLGLYVKRERRYADIGNLHLTKRSASFISLGMGVTIQALRELSDKMAQDNLVSGRNNEWLRVDNAEIGDFPENIKELMNRYWHSIHNHQDLTLNIAPLSMSYVLHNPTK